MRIKTSIALVVCLTLASCQGSTVPSDETAIIESIQKLGGQVQFDAAGPRQRVIKVYLHKTAVQDADLVNVAKLPKLKNLFLGQTSISDVGLDHICSILTLETLSLNSTRVTDSGMKSLSGLTNLKTLNLQETQVTAKERRA